MFFVIPEMPSETYVMALKKLPDHFKEKSKKDCTFILGVSMIILTRLSDKRFITCRDFFRAGPGL